MRCDVNCVPTTFDSEADVLAFVHSRSEETWFDRGILLAEGFLYVYLIEGWEMECIAKVVERENGDWDDDEYLYGLVEDLHGAIVGTDFLDVFGECALVCNELVEGCQFGVSVIVAKLDPARHSAELVCQHVNIS